MVAQSSERTPAQRLLDALGPVDRFHDQAELGDFGMPSRSSMEAMLDPIAHTDPSTRIGPMDKIHVFWFAGMSCDGCTVSVTGAQAPSVESLVLGAHPGLPQVVLHHPVVNVESGPKYMHPHELAVQGKLDAPYAIVLEGSITDETMAMATGGYWVGQGEEPWGPDGAMRTVTTDEWIARLAPGAAASIAIGTCATWGGVPSAAGNPTGAMSLMDFLGKDYRSAFGLPVVNVPGCAPIGDNFTETVTAILYFLQGFGPLPEFDELGRPAWLFGETVHRHCVRGAYYEEGTYAEEFGDKECLVEIGCWGPVVNCNITSRGAINHAGGCMNAGGACIGCTMPGFPDKFTPFYKTPPGSKVSTTASRLLGGLIKPMRKYTNNHLNREVRWDVHKQTPSGWARERSEPSALADIGHKFYDRFRRSTDTGRKSTTPAWGKRDEWTQQREPATETRLPGGEQRDQGRE
ncbi:NADH-quinone oxidoreductase subunit B family protein [Haloechinothrix halophila]|uniref:NADH-quinone oxidoreductase subunit B family protein n=1 Tax=Haloechinothrix halophila TaxID=1069073 RepID=UPI001E37B052|nr:hydrogenase expression protein HypE [Haloechinothrix halophila]